MAKLVNYRWISYKAEDDSRYSDWDRSERCSKCQAEIVHVYETSDGQFLGRDCLDAAGQRSAGKVEKAAKSEQAARALLLAEKLKFSKPSEADARLAFRQNNPNFTGSIVAMEIAEGRWTAGTAERIQELAQAVIESM